MRDEIRRVTRKERLAATLNLVSAAVDSYGSEDFPAARRKLTEAKGLSSRSAAIRELLGLSAYRCGAWEESLAELRAYRRLAGDTTHMPVEMDNLRALERYREVEVTWVRFGELGGNRPTRAEARVVFASYLLDQGRPEDAWSVIRPHKLAESAPPYELRRWFVAARCALALGEVGTADRLAQAVRRADPNMPGIVDLLGRVNQQQAN